MCKNCVQATQKLWEVLFKTGAFAQHFSLEALLNFVYTTKSLVSTEFTHIRNALLHKGCFAYLPTLSTTPITTTIYIYNNNTVGGLKEVS